MMAYMASHITDIADMPRGGPDASWLDRLLETDRIACWKPTAPSTSTVTTSTTTSNAAS